MGWMRELADLATHGHARDAYNEMVQQQERVARVGMGLVVAYMLQLRGEVPDIETIADTMAFARLVIHSAPLDKGIHDQLNRRHVFIGTVKYMNAFGQHYAKTRERMNEANWQHVPLEVRRWAINVLHAIDDMD